VGNLRRLLREYGFAATFEQPLGGNRPGGFLRAVGGVKELRGIEQLVLRFEAELRGRVGLRGRRWVRESGASTMSGSSSCRRLVGRTGRGMSWQGSGRRWATCVDC